EPDDDPDRCVHHAGCQVGFLVLGGHRERSFSEATTIARRPVNAPLAVMSAPPPTRLAAVARGPRQDRAAASEALRSAMGWGSPSASRAGQAWTSRGRAEPAPRMAALPGRE